MLKAIGLHKNYGSLPVLRGIDLDIASGEVVALVGSSGAGKTTLLNLLGTLDRPDSGEIHIGGVNLAQVNDRQLAAFRNRHVGFVFQFHNLLAEFTALENVLMPAWIGGVKESEARTRGILLLETLGLSERAAHKPSQLSGGEQQRVAVARALINRPGLLLADEPTGNLDTENALLVIDLLVEAARQESAACLLVTHNLALAARADRSLFIRDGRILDKAALVHTP